MFPELSVSMMCLGCEAKEFHIFCTLFYRFSHCQDQALERDRPQQREKKKSVSSINSLPPLVDGVCGRIFCKSNWLTPRYYSHEQHGFCEQPQSGQNMRSRHTLHRLQHVPMLGTIIEQNGDGLLGDSHMPVGWSRTSMVPSGNVAFIDLQPSKNSTTC